MSFIPATSTTALTAPPAITPVPGDAGINKTSDAQNLVFVANRADDDWFENQSRSMNVHYFNITYTAGRRKKDGNTYSAKKAREILLYKTDRYVL